MSDKAQSELINWRLLTEQLQAGAYEEVATRLWELELASQQVSDGVTAAVFAAIRQLCLACRECQIKIAEHQQAITASVQREAELRTHAEAMLARMAGTLLAADTEKRPPVVYPFSPLIRQWVSIWSRVWRWLGKGVPPPPLLSAPPLRSPSIFAPDLHLEAGPVQTDTTPEEVVTVSSVAAGQALLEMPRLATEPPELSAVTTDCTDAGMDNHTDAGMDSRTDAGINNRTDTGMDNRTNDRAGEQSTLPPIAEAPMPLKRNAEAVGLPPEQPLPSTSVAPSLVIYCLGNFQVYQDEHLIIDWPSSKGQLIFKYLLFQRNRPVAKEVLMALFWPDSPPDAARNNLNVAIYGLRRALRRGRTDFSHILFQTDCYLLNPALTLWLDVEEFTRQVSSGQRYEQSGQIALAMRAYRAAEALYHGEFLAEERYEDWLLPQRQWLQDEYLKLLDHLSQYYLEQQEYELCATMGNKLLAVDSCQEDAHRRLMHCYNRQGQYHLALRQYHRCVEALARELDVGPSQATKDLYDHLRKQAD